MVQLHLRPGSTPGCCRCQGSHNLKTLGATKPREFRISLVVKKSFFVEFECGNSGVKKQQW